MAGRAASHGAAAGVLSGVGGLRQLEAAAVEVVADVAAVALAPGRVADRVAAMLTPLRRLVPYQSAWFSLFDPDRGRFVTVLAEGYDQRTREYLDGPEMAQEMELIGLRGRHPPIRVRDLPMPADDLPVWGQYLRPAGFREGVGVPLCTPDGRYLGMMMMQTDTVAHPTDAAARLVGALSPVMARAVDPTRSISALARLVVDAFAGVALTAAGDPLPLPGLASHPALARDSALLGIVLSRSDDDATHVRFLWWDQPSAGVDGLVRVTVLVCPRAADEPRAVVLLSPPGDVHGLTQRELEVCGLLVLGWGNARIAQALAVAPRTVANHLEHIRAKLGAASRTVAAVRALRQGLYLPPVAANAGGPVRSPAPS